MSHEDQLQSQWLSRPVETADLDTLLKAIESAWKEAIEKLGPACLAVENRHPAYGHLSFAFGQAVSLRSQAALYQAQIDNLGVIPRDLANIYCFSMISGSLYDQHRSYGFLLQKVNASLAIDDEKIAAIADDLRAALAIANQAISLTKLFKVGLDRLWKQFYMPETLDFSV